LDLFGDSIFVSFILEIIFFCCFPLRQVSGLTLADVTKYGRPGIRAQLFNTRVGALEMDFRIEVRC
jgi:hypothetical protein